MIRRSKLEICLDVLSVVENGTSKPTRIMYESNLSWKSLEKILKLLMSKGLIREIVKHNTQYAKRQIRRYEITQNGKEFIKYLNRAKNLLKLEEIPMKR